MISGNTIEFVDNLYYGSEMYFMYKNKRYFIQGWVEDSIHYLVLDYDYENSDTPDNHSFSGYLWEYKSSDTSECVKAFLDAPLWDTKTFYDVENEITWMDP